MFYIFLPFKTKRVKTIPLLTLAGTPDLGNLWEFISHPEPIYYEGTATNTNKCVNYTSSTTAKTSSS